MPGLIYGASSSTSTEAALTLRSLRKSCSGARAMEIAEHNLGIYRKRNGGPAAFWGFLWFTFGLTMSCISLLLAMRFLKNSKSRLRDLFSKSEESDQMLEPFAGSV